MKLFRTINSQFDPNQPLIQWDGDVRGIIAARRAAEMAQRSASPRLRVAPRVTNARRIMRVTAVAPMEAAA
jgi:hypothetical protein